MIEQFTRGVAEHLGWYVYVLVDPKDKSIFYVGKGTGDRCFAHIHEARGTSADSVGDYEKLARIRAIECANQEVGIHLLRHRLDENDALMLEAACIDLLNGFAGLELTNRVRGTDTEEFGLMSVTHANDKYGARPVTLDPAHRVVLVRINRSYHRGMTDREIYEVTRRWWKIASWRCDLDNPGAPQWALGVANGIVRGVYRIEAWERPGDEDIAVDERRRKRWGFRGKRDPELEAMYRGGDVSRYLKSSQWPLQFVP